MAGIGHLVSGIGKNAGLPDQLPDSGDTRILQPVTTMRHQKAGRKLGRNASHRLAMYRNMTRSLIEHGRIVTTEQKAKELRPFVEKLITLAKRGLAAGDPAKALHARRIVMARLGPVAKVELYDKDNEPLDDTVIKKLFNDGRLPLQRPRRRLHPHHQAARTPPRRCGSHGIY